MSAARVLLSAALVILSAAKDLAARPNPVRRFASRLSPLLLFVAPLAAQTTTPWLVGCWSQGPLRESWVRRDDGRMLGVGFRVFPDSLRRTELLELVARDGELGYRARPEGADSVTVFRAEIANSDSLVVTNPAHRNPWRIAYTRSGDSVLHARVTFGGVSDLSGVQHFMFTRRPVCPAVAEVGLLRLNRGDPVRVTTPTARVKGRLSVITADSVAIRDGADAVRVALTDITAVHRQRRSTLRGALIGGGVGGVALGGFLYWILGAMCESTLGCRDDQWGGAAIGFGLGALGGGLIGAGVGSVIPRWERIAP